MNAKVSLVMACAIALAAACSPVPTGLITADDTDPFTEGPEYYSGNVIQELRCRVDLRHLAPLQCAPPGGGDEHGALIVGGQGIYVELDSDTPVPSMAGTVTFPNVTVANLMIQDLGTADGLFPHEDGVRVFFMDLPTNGVTIANASGTAMFLQPDQPFYQYHAFVSAQIGISDSVDWTFDLGAAESFEFSVLVSGAIPHDTAALRIVSAADFESSSWNDVWMASDNFGVAVSEAGEVLAYNGTSWGTLGNPSAGTPLNTAWAADANNVWVAGTHPHIYLWNGTDFVQKSDGIPPPLLGTTRATGLWGTPDGDSVFVTTVESSFGPPTSRVYVTANEGGTWTDWEQLGLGLITYELHAIHGTSSTDLWVAGGMGTNTAVFEYDEGALAWTDYSSAGNVIRDIWVTPEHVWAVGNTGTINRYDRSGESWWDMSSGVPFNEIGLVGPNVISVWAPAPNYVWVGLESYLGTTLWYYEGAGLATPIKAPLDHTLPIRAIHGSSLSNVWMVGESQYAHLLVR